MGWIIPAVQAAYAMYQGSKAGKQAGKSADQQQQLIDLQKQQSTMMFPYQKGWLNSSKEGLSTAQNYWMALASGDRQAMAQALNPEMSQIDRAYQNQRQVQSELNPTRSSGLMDRTNDAQFQQKLGLQINARGGAMSNLANLGLQQGNLGMGAGAQALGGLNAAGGQQAGMTNMWGGMAGGYGKAAGNAFGQWTDYLKDNTWTGKKRVE